jgi:hypothetical protein
MVMLISASFWRIRSVSSSLWVVAVVFSRMPLSPVWNFTWAAFSSMLKMLSWRWSKVLNPNR